MGSKKKIATKSPAPLVVGADFVERFWEQSWTYIKTVVDVSVDPILILDRDLRVMAANRAFFKTFEVDVQETEGRSVYQLGNNQWDIPELRKLLEDILPNKTFFKGFEVTHVFPTIGERTIILNARQIRFRKEEASELFMPIILLVLEDVTDMIAVAQTLAEHTKSIELKLTQQTERLEKHIETLKKEIVDLKKPMR